MRESELLVDCEPRGRSELVVGRGRVGYRDGGLAMVCIIQNSSQRAS